MRPSPSRDPAHATHLAEPVGPKVTGDAKVIARMRRAFDLADLAIRIQRQNLRRRHPDASESETADRLRDWLHHRPGAEHGDVSGPDFRVSERFSHLLGRAEASLPGQDPVPPG